MLWLAIAILVVAIVEMSLAVPLGFELRRLSVAAGVGHGWTWMFGLIVLFWLGYLAFLISFGGATVDPVLALEGAVILALGGQFVLLVLRLYRRTFIELSRRIDADRHLGQLRQTSARLQAVLDGAVETSIIGTDPSGVIQVFNRGAERLLGYRAEEMIGKQTPAIIHVGEEVAAHGKMLSAQYGRTIAGFDTFVEEARRGGHETREWTYVRKDGSTFPVNLTVTALQDGEDRIIGFLGVGSDLTARRGEESRLRAILESFPNGVLLVDAQGVITRVNAAVCRMLQYRPEELVGLKVEQLIPTRNRESHVHLRSSYGAHPQMRAMGAGRELNALRKDGSEIAVEIGLSPLVTTEGHTVVAAISDITERRQAERLLERFFTMSQEMLCIGTLAGGFLRVNPAWTRVLGWTTEEILATSFAELTHPDDRAGVSERMRDATADVPGSIAHECRCRCKDGSYRWLHWNALVSRDEGRIFAVARDTTALRAAQDEMIRARDKAIELAQAKSDFLANMSHEIRTPMNGVIGMTSLLMETPLSPEQRGFAEAIHRSGEALVDIINDILDFSKIEAGRLTLECVDFDLLDLVEDVVQILGEPARRRGLELAALVDAGVPEWFRGDPGRLRQVLTNLVGNAIKFTERGSVLVRVHATPNGDGRSAVSCEVCDTGIGIPAEVLGRLFEAFTQADASTTRRFGGTGLGLAISRRIISAMGGTICVESEPGKGSRFHFTLTLDPGRAVVPPPAADPAALHGVRILAIDDNALNRSVLAAYLADWRADFEVVADPVVGRQRLLEAAASGRPYAIAILDMQMPDVDGLTALRQLQAEPTLHGLRKLILTSTGMELKDACLAAGAEAYFIKPVRKRLLFQALAGGMSVSASRGVTPAPSVAVRIGNDSPRGRILIAEDNPVNQLVVRSMIERIGFECDLVPDGQQALASVESGKYALVLMDCQMPVMDGYAATQAIRRLAGPAAAIPVIALTASAMPEDRERALGAGMTDYLPKPIVLQQLQQVLERALVPPQATPPAAVDAIVLGMLRELVSPHEPDAFRVVLDTYLTDAEARMRSLAECCQNTDVVQILAHAHALKGSARAVGAGRLGDLLDDLERAARAGSLPEIAGLFQAIRDEHVRVRTALQAHL